MNSLIRIEDFEWVGPYIRSIGANGFVKIEVPNELELDLETLKGIFAEDCTIEYTRGSAPILSGTIKSKELLTLLQRLYGERKGATYQYGERKITILKDPFE